jgi:hypothetical protein
MRAEIVVNVTPHDRRQLEAIVADRNAPQNDQLKEITGSGRPIDARNTKSKTIQAPYRWINSFMIEGQSGETARAPQRARRDADISARQLTSRDFRSHLLSEAFSAEHKARPMRGHQYATGKLLASRTM